MVKSTRGFTIVELLIVIVVIAILAAISIVAYTGIQDRATNTATISGVQQAQRVINAYITLNEAYPTTSANRCLTQNNQCYDSAGNPVTTSNTDLINTLNSIGTLPTSVPHEYGLRYSFATGRQMADGTPAEALIVYRLKGANQNCGVTVVGGSSSSLTVQTSGYTSSSSSMTTCWAPIQAP